MEPRQIANLLRASTPWIKLAIRNFTEKRPEDPIEATLDKILEKVSPDKLLEKELQKLLDEDI